MGQTDGEANPLDVRTLFPPDVLTQLDRARLELVCSAGSLAANGAMLVNNLDRVIDGDGEYPEGPEVEAAVNMYGAARSAATDVIEQLRNVFGA